MASRHRSRRDPAADQAGYEGQAVGRVGREAVDGGAGVGEDDELDVGWGLVDQRSRTIERLDEDR
jgi:hypothetical protein